MKKSGIILQTENNEPVVSIQVFNNKRLFDLKINASEYNLTDLNGNSIFPEIPETVDWRVKIKQADNAVFQYYLLIRESSDKNSLINQYKTLSKNSDKICLTEAGGDIICNEKLINNNVQYRLLEGPFASVDEIKQCSSKDGCINHCNIIKKITRKGSGVIEVYDPKFENIRELQNGLKLIPKQKEAYFELANFELNQSNNNDKSIRKNLYYQGTLQVTIDENNLFSGINTLPAEQYIKGVLVSEIESTANLEYAMCMAIVIRSYIFSIIGTRHQEEQFDFCSNSHCVRYYGIRNDLPVIDKAMEMTRGQVLKMPDDNICRTHYSYNCGGHGENASEIWLCDDDQYCTGKPDSDSKNDNIGDLRIEENAIKWINSRPDVYCRQDPSELNEVTELNADSFRWEVLYTRNELEEIFQKKTGENPGIIYEIVPVKRGVSGRIKEIEVLGSLKNCKISGEKNIRYIFSSTFLNSSCFYVHSDLDDDGIPINFTFIGAGKGHGVGLCKTGALHMARYQKTTREILLHYFENCELKRIY
ncbi:MAG: SpoIID/LytB domain-containing protein [Calditrichaceae bacterium]|nr:SpoIID/LytB domain-containing protein [Calditrichaceae bacterium]MBN2709201.1 SpoIID/LytB domain-containing protein [Calditrichaceae bacterium]RQV96156.1 MAG: SpoIID/LytB domain-containing protein [Calditrichota bacterium]